MAQLRIGGLASGMDIDELVDKLMKAERAPLDKLEQQKQTYEWTRDAYRDVNTKLQTFDTYISDNLILKNFNTKTVTTSNSDLVTATATGSASGTLTIEGVSQLATAARNVGKQINATGSTKLSDLGISGNGYFELKAIKSDGTMPSEATKIEYSDSMTISQLISKINSSGAGVTAIFESGRLSISAKNTGNNKEGAEVQLFNDSQDIFSKLGIEKDTSADADPNGIAWGGTNAVFQVNGIATERTTNTFSINGYNVTLKSTFNTDKTTAEKYNAALTEYNNTHSTEYNTKIDTARNAKDAADAAYQTALNAFNTAKDNLFGTISESELSAYNKVYSNLNSTELSTISSLNFGTEEAYNTWLQDNSDPSLEDLKNKLRTSNVSFEEFNSLKSIDSDKASKINLQKAYDSLGANFLGNLTSNELTSLKNAGTPFTLESLNAKINDWKTNGNDEEKALADKLSKLDNAQKTTLVGLNNGDLDSLANVASLYVDSQTKLNTKNTTEQEHQALVDRQKKAELDFEDAKKSIEGKNYTIEDDGTIKVNSLSNPVNLTATTNVDDIISKIKDFVNTYNGLVKELNNLTKEQKYRDYPPLTSAQREEMEEKEIELWEKKAKSGILRSDSIIRDGIANMRALVYQSHDAVSNKKYNTLFSVGITTSKNYNEGGTLEIDEAKLRKALEDDPDAVTALFTNLGDKEEKIIENGVEKKVDTRGYLYKLREQMTKIKEKIEKKAGRSTMTESQYTLGQTLKDIESRISSWKSRLEDIENRYWKQFTAMEQAINKANMQSSLFMQQ